MNSQEFVDDLQKEVLETANTSGGRYIPYAERLERENKELHARIAELEKEIYNLQHSITQAIDPRRKDAK